MNLLKFINIGYWQYDELDITITCVKILSLFFSSECPFYNKNICKVPGSNSIRDITFFWNKICCTVTYNINISHFYRASQSIFYGVSAATFNYINTFCSCINGKEVFCNRGHGVAYCRPSSKYYVPRYDVISIWISCPSVLCTIVFCCKCLRNLLQLQMTSSNNFQKTVNEFVT